MAIPAALVMRRWGYKAGMVMGLGLFGGGMILFWPAAVSGLYVPFLVALFAVGCGASVLETAANPFMAQFGPAATSDEAIDAHIRATAVTAHHPAGTCRMGTDAMAVVDPELRVRGTEGLRVVDASVFPDLVGGNINAPVVMIAEKAADLIRGRTPLAPAMV